MTISVDHRRQVKAAILKSYLEYASGHNALTKIRPYTKPSIERKQPGYYSRKPQ